MFSPSPSDGSDYELIKIGSFMLVSSPGEPDYAIYRNGNFMEMAPNRKAAVNLCEDLHLQEQIDLLLDGPKK